jgi:hypothetical protein
MVVVLLVIVFVVVESVLVCSRRHAVADMTLKIGDTKMGMGVAVREG